MSKPEWADCRLTLAEHPDCVEGFLREDGLILVTSFRFDGFWGVLPIGKTKMSDLVRIKSYATDTPAYIMGILNSTYPLEHPQSPTVKPMSKLQLLSE